MIIQNPSPKGISIINTIDNINIANFATYEEGGDYYLYDINTSTTLAGPFRKILPTFTNSFLFEKSDGMFEAYTIEGKKIATINNGSFLRPVALGNYIANIEQDGRKFEVDLYDIDGLKPAVNIKFNNQTLGQPQIVGVSNDCIEIANMPFASIGESLLHIDFNGNNIDLPEKYKDMTKKMFGKDKFFMTNLTEEGRIYDRITGKETGPYKVRPFPYFQEGLAVVIEKGKSFATIINENLETVFTTVTPNLAKLEDNRIRPYFFKDGLVVIGENVYNKEGKVVYSNTVAKNINIIGGNDNIKCLSIEYQTATFTSCLKNEFINNEGEVIGQFDSNDGIQNQIITMSKDSVYLTAYDLVDMNINYGLYKYILKIPFSNMFFNIEQLKSGFFKVNGSYYHLPNLDTSSGIETKINEILGGTKVEMDENGNFELKGKRFKRKLLKIN